MGRHQDALYAFRQALAANPRNFEAHYNLANLLTLSGQEQEAIQHYMAFISSAPARYNALKGQIRKMLEERGAFIQQKERKSP
jgi:tetratricopeptide (TPR) repeat protein